MIAPRSSAPVTAFGLGPSRAPRTRAGGILAPGGREIRTIAARLPSRGLTAPGRDGPMVAGQEHLGDLHPPHRPWPRVLRMVQPALILERLDRQRLLVADHAWHQPRDR